MEVPLSSAGIRKELRKCISLMEQVGMWVSLVFYFSDLLGMEAVETND